MSEVECLNCGYVLNISGGDGKFGLRRCPQCGFLVAKNHTKENIATHGDSQQFNSLRQDVSNSSKTNKQRGKMTLNNIISELTSDEAFKQIRIKENSRAKKDKMKAYIFSISIILAGFLGAVVLFNVTHKLRLSGKREMESKKPLCVVCKKEAIRKTEQYYAATKDSPFRNKAWLCASCSPPGKVSLRFPVHNGAISNLGVEATPSNALSAITMFGAIICIGIVSMGFHFLYWLSKGEV